MRGWQAGGGGPLLSAREAVPAPLLCAGGLVLGAQPGFCSSARVELPPERGWGAGHVGGMALGEGWRGVSLPMMETALTPPRRSAAAGCINLCSATCILLQPGLCPAPGGPLEGRGSPAAGGSCGCRAVRTSSCLPGLQPPRWWEQMAARHTALLGTGQAWAPRPACTD